MKKIVVIVVLILIAQFSFGQQFTDLCGDYLGQTPPGDIPQVFAPGIVSKENSKEHCLAVSPKGDEMFFTAGTGWPNSIIMHVKKNGDKWVQPEPASFLKNDWATQPAFSPDGLYLYFSSSRGETDIRLYSIWRCKKTASGWSVPEKAIEMDGDMIMLFHPTVDSDGSVYFLRFDYPNQTGDLYVAEASSDTLDEPVKLNSPISTEFNEVRPTVDPLGRYLLFVSDRPDGCGGKDVYACYRNADGAWSVPQSLGPEINSPGNDDVPTISPDGKYWFFEKNEDIYWRRSPLNFDDATVTDIDGNVYHTVTIGTQTWMLEDLKTTRYRNGNSIGTTNPATLNIDSENMPKYQWAYNGDEKNVADYGRLYTWYAATDKRNICPAGWHVPTDAEWETLINFLGGEIPAQGKLKEAGTKHWNSPNTDATNESGFTAIPGGNRFNDVLFIGLGEFTHWWTATEYDTELAWRRVLGNGPIDNTGGYAKKNIGWLVRCIKD